MWRSPAASLSGASKPVSVATIWNGGTSLSATCLWQPKLRRYTVNKVAQRVAPIFIGGSFRCYPAQLYFLENSVAARRPNQRARRTFHPAWVTWTPLFAVAGKPGQKRIASLPECEHKCRSTIGCNRLG